MRFFVAALLLMGADVSPGQGVDIGVPVGSAAEFFKIVKVATIDCGYAVSHLDKASSTIVLPGKVTTFDEAKELVRHHVNIAGPGLKRAGQCEDWILFPRLDSALDDGSFTTGYAIHLGTNALVRWDGKTPQPTSSKSGQ